MKIASVFNNVLGPVMRGPSSSHTAGSFHIGRLARDILGAPPARAAVSFDDAGSYARTYREQGSDKAFVCGVMDWDLLGAGFHDALRLAGEAGTDVTFASGSFEGAAHPNWVRLELEGARGESSTVEAASVGGGSVAVSRVDGFDTELHGDAWVTLAETPGNLREAARKILSPHGKLNFVHNGEKTLAILQSGDEPTKETLAALASNGVAARVIRPVFFPVKGAPLWNSAESLENYASANSLSIAESCAEYEQALLGMTRGEVMAEMKRRYSIMKASCESALAGRLEMPMQLLRPTADKIFAAASSGKSKFSGPHAKAAARAMAIMHANGGMNVVVAAPTGGAAGALPAVIITLEEHLGLSEDEACMALFAAAAVGVIVDSRTTFAAEVAGCQVEIGAGAAMASAACAYACGGTAKEALDAAAISFQNTMGLVCDPVQGMVEIPCHTRNAVYAASAFVNADIATGGYENPLPLDETIDAVFATGLMIPPELRCTSMGGLSLCPSGLAMPRLR